MQSTLPQQKLPKSQKNEEWKRMTVDYFERMSRVTSTGNRSGNWRKLVNYELFNGRFNKADLEYVTNPVGLPEYEFPATLQHYDIISPTIMLLIGEEAARVDTQLVVSEGPDDIDRKKSNLGAKIKQALIDEVKAELGELDPKDVRTPEEIIKYEKYSTSDLIESQANKLLKVLKKHLDLKNTYKSGWKDALICGEEIYWTGILNGEPVTRRVNPVDTSFIMQVDKEFIDDSVAVVEVRLMPISSILDEYGEFLKPGQIDKLEELSKTFYSKNISGGSFNIDTDGGVQILPTGINSTANYAGKTYDGSIRVVRVEWISMRKIGTLSYIDPETGEEREIDVDEDFNFKLFKETTDPEAKINWFWINEAWEGIKIGNDMYINIRPKPNQRRRLDNPYYCRLGYTGVLYNATNSVGVSLIDRMKPYQYLYNIIMYRLELAFASDMGKVMVMDLAQIPKSEGIDIEKWMYYLKAMKIGFINSFEESNKGTRLGQISAFNQFQSIDLSLANVINQYIQSLEYIKNQVSFLSGVSPQRMSAIKSSELVGNVEKAIEQSSYITNYWFDMHNEVKRRTYTALIECAKIAYREGTRKQYVLDDMGIELLEIDGMQFENSEFSVYVSNTTRDFEIKEQIKSLFQTALTADKASLSDIIEILQNDSIKDLQHKMQNSEQNREQQQQKLQEMQQQAQQAIADQEMQIKQQELDLKNRELEIDQYKIEADNETKIRVAEIGNYFKVPDTDSNENGIPDPMEIADISIKERQLANDNLHKHKDREHKNQIEQKKLDSAKKLQDMKNSLEEKKMKSNEKIEKMKAETQLKVTKISAKAKNKTKPKS